MPVFIWRVLGRCHYGCDNLFRLACYPVLGFWQFVPLFRKHSNWKQFYSLHSGLGGLH